jgi:hypothetical protein
MTTEQKALCWDGFKSGILQTTQTGSDESKKVATDLLVLIVQIEEKVKKETK